MPSASALQAEHGVADTKKETGKLKGDGMNNPSRITSLQALWPHGRPPEILERSEAAYLEMIQPKKGMPVRQKMIPLRRN